MAAATVLVTIMAVGAAHAWIPNSGGNTSNQEIETRFVFWGAWHGHDLVGPGTPARTADVQDFFVPFLRSNPQSGFNHLLVDRSVVAAVRPAREGSRDDGVMAWGNARVRQYRAAILDGSGQEDHNTGCSPRGSVWIAWNRGARGTGSSCAGTSIGREKRLPPGLQRDVQRDRAGPWDPGFTTEPRNYLASAPNAHPDYPFGNGWAVTMEGAWIERLDDCQASALSRRHIGAFLAQSALLLPAEMRSTRRRISARLDDLDSEREDGCTSTTGRTPGPSCFLRGHDQKVHLDDWRRT